MGDNSLVVYCMIQCIDKWNRFWSSSGFVLRGCSCISSSTAALASYGKLHQIHERSLSDVSPSRLYVACLANPKTLFSKRTCLAFVFSSSIRRLVAAIHGPYRTSLERISPADGLGGISRRCLPKAAIPRDRSVSYQDACHVWRVSMTPTRVDVRKMKHTLSVVCNDAGLGYLGSRRSASIVDSWGDWYIMASLVYICFWSRSTSWMPCLEGTTSTWLYPSRRDDKPPPTSLAFSIIMATWRPFSQGFPWPCRTWLDGS